VRPLPDQAGQKQITTQQREPALLVLRYKAGNTNGTVCTQAEINFHRHQVISQVAGESIIRSEYG